MPYQFLNYRATKPIARLRNKLKCQYEVYFIVYDALNHKHIFRFSDGINSLPPKQRLTQARALAQHLWEQIQNGWNPAATPLPEVEPVAEVMTFKAGLDFALKEKEKHLSKYSMYDYRGCVRFVNKVAGVLLSRPVQMIKRKDIKILMAEAKEQNNWSSNSRNKYLTILQALLSVLVDEEILEYNPAHKIKSEPTNEGAGFRSATEFERERIANELLLKDPAFFEYVVFIYQSGIRRKELLMIRIKDINLVRREIRIRPEVSKTNRERVVPFPDDIFSILMNREVYNLPGEWFLFSNDNFKPGENPYHPNTPTNRWRKLVQEGLGIDLKLYGMKHSGADAKIFAGIDLDVLKTLYGHKSKKMTENYAKAIRQQYADIIKTQSPGFTKVVQMKKAK